MRNLLKTTTLVLLILNLAHPLQAGEDNRPIHRNALKTTFLSLITGSAKLTYERVVFPEQSVEVTAGIIGVGFDKFRVNPKGGLVRAGYKFNLLQQANSTLGGLYVRPEYAWSFFDYDARNGSGDRIRSSMQTIMGCIGYQHVIKRLVLEGFVGAGIEWGEPVELQYHHGFVERYGWLTLTFGVRVGVAF
ncbi:MAG: hypothetical protein FWG79_04960 [Bacteroidales bacterium]|nr:hypothetical protein [Bacteroidales bacterium]